MRVSKEPSPRGREASFFLAGERKGAVGGAVSELWLDSLVGAVVWGEGSVGGGGAGGAVAAYGGAAAGVAVVVVAVAAS